MKDIKVILIAVISLLLTLQCDAYTIKSKWEHEKISSKQILTDSDCSNCRKKRADDSNTYHHQTRQPRSVNSDNSAVLEEKEHIASMQISKTETDIKVKKQTFYQNISDEYKHEVFLSNDAWHAEQGEYEDRDGASVFVIRGVFSHPTREGTQMATLYVLDEFGYYNMQAPSLLTKEDWSLFGYRPENASATVLEEKQQSESMETMASNTDIKVKKQTHYQNASGEYKHEMLISNTAWHAEQGEYEDHNGVIVFVIRGVFSYPTREGLYVHALYIVDEFGYHNVQAPPTFVDYRPDYDATSDCKKEKETYCIDIKLLALLVG